VRLQPLGHLSDNTGKENRLRFNSMGAGDEPQL
jgi:hypothetical protein